MAQASGIPVEEEGSTRDRMLDAALRAFSELGFDGASTREIASRAGVNQGLIPYYFGSKQGLWREAVDRSFTQLQSEVERTVQNSGARDGRTVAAEVIRAVVQRAAENPEFHRLMTSEGKSDGPRLHWIVDQHVRPLYQSLARIAREAGPDTLLANLDPILVHYLLVGATTHLFHQAPECVRLTGRDPSEAEMVRAHGDALVAMFLGPDVEGTAS